MTAQPTTAGVEISLRIGQRARHHDFHGKRVTGVVCGLSVDSYNVLQVDIVLDEPLVIAPAFDGDRELRIYRQHVPAHELQPFDEREEVIAQLLDATRAAEAVLGRQKWIEGSTDPEAVALSKLRDAIVKATGGAR
jgi:hypothetical protein